ncbi:pyridoxal phosphate-dependent aminotransferase [Flavobacterium columnare NBRC 100251 = ATCC 23463]|uniref:Aminotransferase n=1 Tax=Flavobacterium columnare (strain ATCC 49512 / CIP 103533 / TG 44/87) TaxID=1041826 RepID=G8X551_FLACA|nr:pyridoxal phosphate-dependent aminotransferase [Flavobacterium columnare]AEW85462.1 class I and II aminotransferase [Flavobacterium columnare ATCC 49512]ANO49344.1 class I and II aminotransferase [Flavobacterium columnare]APT22683.1 aspartate aminotransferase [Flavobacterium columnare]MBF6654304.1 pyridoxal phosphate-dependent aminotransferase [Flavobacterium columnare]MBF6656748.1 pyridoxal phosphate-dependent aminotransferase [Flavobacterium columnare]
MNNILSERINSLAVSQTLAMAALARELKAQGKDIISLSLGEPDFNTPDFIKEAAKQAIDDNFSAYPPVEGYLDLKEAICAKFKRDNNLHYTPAQIVVSTGAKQSLYNIAQVMLNHGDEVVLPAPYWVSYFEIIKLSGGTPIEVPTSVASNFKITPAQLEAAITPKTKMMWFSSPCNPSGSIYSKEELEALAEILKKHPNIYVVSDEIYEHINYTGNYYSIGSIPGMENNVITVNGVAKAFAMTGWRMGYIGAPEFIAKACTKMQGQVTSGANTIAQRATKAAVEANPEAIKYMVDSFEKRRGIVYQLLSEIPGFKLTMPEGAFYFFPDVSEYFGKILRGKEIKDANDFAMYLLAEANVATVTGDAFGNPNCIRLSYATSEELLREAIKRIKEALV